MAGLNGNNGYRVPEGVELSPGVQQLLRKQVNGPGVGMPFSQVETNGLSPRDTLMLCLTGASVEDADSDYSALLEEGFIDNVERALEA